MHTWTSCENGLITRWFTAAETRFLRDGLAEVKTMVLTRLVECRENLIEYPFGDSIDIAVTARQSDDPYLQRLMGAFLRTSPHEAWGLYECDLWEELVIGIAQALADLPPDGGGRVELDDVGAEWLHGTLIATGIVHIEHARHGFAAIEPGWIDETQLIYGLVRELEPFVHGAFPTQPEFLLNSRPD